MTQMNRHRREIEKGWETKHKGDQRKIKDGVVCRWNTGTRSGEGANNSPNSTARLCWRSVKCLVSSICQKGTKNTFRFTATVGSSDSVSHPLIFYSWVPGADFWSVSLRFLYEIISWASYSKQAALKKQNKKTKLIDIVGVQFGAAARFIRPAWFPSVPVWTILSILMLELSSSLAKACTACSRSSQVSGSM